MTVALGSLSAPKHFLGSTEISKAYLGSSVVIDTGLSLEYKNLINDPGTKTTYTYTSVDFGDPDDSRRIVIGVQGRRDSGGTVISATIGGVSATIHLNTSLGQGSVSTISAIVPTGTTGTVSVTWSILQAGCGINVYRITGESNSTPVFATAATSNPLDITAALTKNTAVIGHARSNGNRPFTWSGTLGVTEDVDSYPIADVNTFSSASALTDSGGSVIATPTSFSGGCLHLIGFE